MQQINIITAFLIGFISLAIQPLILRDYMTFFQSDSFAISCFFSSWLISGAIGALSGRFIKIHGSLLFLLFIPALFLVKESLFHIHSILEISRYSMIPVRDLFLAALIINFPINFISGSVFSAIFFTHRKNPQSVSLIYICECLGCFTGALLTAAALHLKTDQNFLLFIITSVSLVPPAVYLYYKRYRFPQFLLFITLALVIFSAPFTSWGKKTETHIWQQFFPGEKATGSFTTANSAYLFGSHKDQFIITGNGTIEEQLPDRESSAAPVAMHMAQNPRAENILLAGSSLLPMVDEILKYPAIKKLHIAGTDPVYLQKALQVLPEEYSFEKNEKLKILEKDIRSFLESDNEKIYDLVIINLPLPSNAAFHRFFTIDFFKIAAKRMNKNGVFCISMQNNENYLGKEKSLLAATALKTIESVFPHCTLIPGKPGWLIASDNRNISNDPVKLAENAKTIKGMESIFPPDNFHKIFSRKTALDNISKFRQLRDKTETSSDFNPRLLFISYLITGKMFTGRETSFLLDIPETLINNLLIIFIYLLIMRFLYLLPFPIGKKMNPFEAILTIFIGGLSSLTMYLCILYMFQTIFGSLYINAGFLSALYMIGLFLGGALSNKYITEKKDLKTFVRIILIAASILAVWIAFKLSGAVSSLIIFLLLTFLTGLFHGPLFPSSCKALKSCGLPLKSIASLSWGLDQSGALTGSILSGIILIPLFGPAKTILILLLFFALLFILISIPRETPADTSLTKTNFRMTAYICFGFILFLFIMRFSDRLIPEKTTQLDIDNQSETISFTTQDIAGEVKGYHDHVPLKIQINKEGLIENIVSLPNNETPVFSDRCQSFIKKFQGQNIYEAEALEKVDIVSGATYTSRAIKDSIILAGQRINKKGGVDYDKKYSSSFSSRNIDERVLVIAVLIIVAFLLQLYPGKRRRRLFLFTTALVSGFFFKTQLTLSHLLSLLSFNLPTPGINIPFFLTLFIPVMIILFGNFYCSWICPFGALQELFGDIFSAKIKLPANSLLRKIKSVRFAALAFLLTAFFFTGNVSLIPLDPMIAFFVNNGLYSLVLASVITLSSVFFKRLWCMAVCPVGSFLTLLNDRPWIKKISTTRKKCCTNCGALKNEEK